jgi:hypothetical protein
MHLSYDSENGMSSDKRECVGGIVKGKLAMKSSLKVLISEWNFSIKKN